MYLLWLICLVKYMSVVHANFSFDQWRVPAAHPQKKKKKNTTQRSIELEPICCEAKSL